ncbi:MAG TPA: hypothetical protein VJU77_17125 [Chthoniobacterales bacterium]|nr:hypothetical protein [Chthoniobacterales bacterium]
MSHALQTLAANILDHPWLILIFAAIGFIQWLAKKGKSSENVSEPPPPPSEPLPRNNPQSEEERIRRFLEALGQPRGAHPPPPVARRPTVRGAMPHVPPLPSPLPRLKTVPPPLPAAVEPPPMPQRSEPQIPRPVPVSELSFEIRRPGEVDDPSRRSGKVAQPDLSTLAGRLKTTQSLRDAIVLREIFGPPRSLQPIDLTSGL